MAGFGEGGPVSVPVIGVGGSALPFQPGVSYVDAGFS